MKINEHGLNDTIEEIQNIVRNLEIAKDTASSIVIPAGFAGGGTIRAISDKIDGVLYNEKGMIEWIGEAVERFREARMNNEGLVAGLVSGGNTEKLTNNEKNSVAENLFKKFENLFKQIGEADTDNNENIAFSISELFAMFKKNEGNSVVENLFENFENSYKQIGEAVTDTIENITSSISELFAMFKINEKTEDEISEVNETLDEDITELSNEELLNKFQEIMQTGGKSDSEILDKVYAIFKKDIENGNEYAKEILNKVIDVKEKHPQFAFVRDDEAEASAYAHYTSIVCGGLGDVSVAFSTRSLDSDISFRGTLYHELGHILHAVITQNVQPDGWNKLLEEIRIKTSGEDKDKRKALERKMEESLTSDYSIALDAFYGEVAEHYGVEVDQACSALVLDLRERGYSDDEIKAYIAAGFQKMIDIFKFDDRREAWYYLSDIMDGIYEGKGIDLNGEDLYIPGGHGREYFSRSGMIILECVADFTELKITESEEQLEIIKETFGEEFYNELEEIFNSIMDGEVRDNIVL